jgi:hypothetical protein
MTHVEIFWRLRTGFPWIVIRKTISWLLTVSITQQLIINHHSSAISSYIYRIFFPNRLTVATAMTPTKKAEKPSGWFIFTSLTVKY